MKVEQNKAFQPITITLETKFEARVLKTLVGHILGGGKFRDTTSELFMNLECLNIASFRCSDNFDSDSVDLES